jgi:class 3 adenylate cyclase
MRLEEGTVTATVMITDMVGSTRLRAEQGDDVADLVRRRHDRIVRRAVERSRGAVVKGTGDGILASFGAASDAVAAAVEVQQQLTAEGPAEGRRTPVSVRVGLAAGDVTWEAGDCFGMPVVEAARLESEAAGGEILATELVRLLAGGRGGHRFEPLGERLVRGVPHPITISRVEWTPRAGGTTPIDCPLPPELVGPPEPLIGREEQLEDLATAWRRVEGGERQLVLVSGEPGVGKTRLLRAMALEVTDAGGLVLFGSWERDGGSSYRPFARALGWLTEHLADGDRAAMVRGRAELGALVPSLIPDGAGPPGPGSVDRLPLFDAVAATLRELAGRQPVCLILDDLHWADRSSLGLIEHLTAASAACRLAIVLEHR